MSRHRVSTRVLILSDTHSADPVKYPGQPFSQPLPEADVAIHAGDLTLTGKIEEHKRAVALLKSLPAPLKIVIPGNHDLSLDREYCARHPLFYAWDHLHTQEELDQAYELYTNQDATDAGIVYMVEGTRSFHLANGAMLKIYVSAYTPEFYDWGFPYNRDEDRFNSSKDSAPNQQVPDFDEDVDAAVTLMITHGPPKGILDQTSRGETVGCDHLMRAVSRCKPTLHCFGHIHEAWGQHRIRWADVNHETRQPDTQVQNRLLPLTSEQTEQVGYIDASSVQHGQETIFVNASIMTLAYKPEQKPWVVDLALPASI